MERKWIVLGSIAAAMLFAASAASAGQGSATVSVRTETSAGGVEVKPEVRIWINGKEVNPGDAIDLGGLRIEGGADLKDLRSERGERQPPQSYLGILVGPTEEKAGAEGGARVNSVMPDSPAAAAGLAEGDIITALGDTRITGPQQFVELIRGHKPGDMIAIKWTRDGKQLEKRMTLAARPERGPEPSSRREEGRKEGPKEELPTDAFLGVAAAPLTDDMKQIAGTDRGVLINSLRDGSSAAQAGLLPGDVITAIDGNNVDTPTDLVDRVRGHKPGDSVRVDYFRSGKKCTADVKLGTRPPEERRHEGAGELEGPEGMLDQVPELKGYMDQLRHWLEQSRARRGGEMPMPNMPVPRVAPEMPQAPRWQYALPAPPAAPAPRQDSYDVGKDIGKILERLDRLDKRLGDIERRLDRLEKRPER
jgi:hypothetical protein